MPAPQFQLANEYATVLRLQALREQARLPMLRAAVEAARAKLIEAQRDRKVLEALRDRHRLRWEREQLKAEQKMIDEAAVSAYIRRRSA
jgi:flagellar FliJ protein